ncbi:MAG: phenylacetic acid degradation protein PaaB [Actinomycetota bacterium]
MRTYEVFLRRRGRDDEGSFRHVGSVQAPSSHLALDYGHEVFGRRADVEDLWVVDRTDINGVTAADRASLAVPARRPYRLPGFFIARGRTRGIDPSELDE